MDKCLGVCIGASSITLAARKGEGFELFSRPHDGHLEEVIKGSLESLLPARLGITGRKFRSLLNNPTISEPEAVELAWGHLRERYPETDAIVSAGSETFLLYRLDGRGRIRDVQTGNKCASGTGEFFLQQVRRMGLEVSEALRLADRSEPYPLAGRCSVFCKSDCTHALNKGVAKGEVSAGLCRMLSGKIVELLKKSKACRPAIVGGVTRNSLVIDFLRESYPYAYAPDEAIGLEAVGALLWSEEHGSVVGKRDISWSRGSSFSYHPSLEEGTRRVTSVHAIRGDYDDCEYLLGLDVGSTTTKAVLVGRNSLKIVSDVYLRTNGDPVAASRACYEAILCSFPEGVCPEIVALAVTGSGRRIASLHAMTDGVVNEIIAHAAAAAHFDPCVDTIFEIGGQDAKYTFLVNGVATDYAMNEACSAGTGSFLEEACRETLGIATEEIASHALAGGSPPNFSDQCSAFIGSDIKSSLHEGIPRDDIMGGLVYSVCQNYLNRVKGSRPIGRKIFMQGGVCYNDAVPAAMAVLCGRDIVVPPDPGLMGAFGAALVAGERLADGEMAPGSFNLRELVKREVVRRESFVCPGDRHGCDLGCSIARIEVGGRIYPFGGACSKYENRVTKKDRSEESGIDLVSFREELLSRSYSTSERKGTLRIGVLPSLFGATFLPLYTRFFSALGLEVIIPESPSTEGMENAGAPFCHPVAQSHGYLRSLLDKKVDIVFVPHVRNASTVEIQGPSCTCPFVQAEPSILRAAFHDDLSGRLLSPHLDFSDRKSLGKFFVETGRKVGVSDAASRLAFMDAWEEFSLSILRMEEEGRRFLDSLEPGETAFVIFGRPYNAFSRNGNLGIPRKFSGRGYKVIPHDFLTFGLTNDTSLNRMYWSAGRTIMESANLVAEHPSLFGVYITNFSCGPDSFLLGYFRDRMGQKPSLTLELDAHTSDAGIDTRIEAFIDVVRGYRVMGGSTNFAKRAAGARTVLEKGKIRVKRGDGNLRSLTDPEVRLIIPSMGDAGTRFMAAAFRHEGICALPLPPPSEIELNLGKTETSCKECLPLQLTTGSLIRYLNETHRPGELPVYFMPETDGPCRFGQYSVFFEKYLRRHGYDDVSLLTLCDENGYAGLSSSATMRVWLGVAASDALEDIRCAISALACDPHEARGILASCVDRIERSFEKDNIRSFFSKFAEEMDRLSLISCKGSIKEITRVALVGEIYVRRDDFSRRNLGEFLAGHGIAMETAPLAEWIHFCDYNLIHGTSTRSTFTKQCSSRIRSLVKRRAESRVRQIAARSGFILPHTTDIPHLVRRGSRLVTPRLTSETILTVASTLTSLGEMVHGVISLGPFGCMPNRIAEGILTHRLVEEKPYFSKLGPDEWRRRKGELPLPFLSIETDGNPFPQVVQARLESFIHSAHRLRKESLLYR